MNMPSQGGLIHLDIKCLGRFNRVGHRITGNRMGQSNRCVGWEYVHVYIDDASRIAFTGVFPDEKAVSAVSFLKAAVAYCNSLGIAVTRVMTDNGACYTRPGISREPARRSASSTSAPSPTHPRPTARPSASSRQHHGSGPMHTRIQYLSI